MKPKRTKVRYWTGVNMYADKKMRRKWVIVPMSKIKNVGGRVNAIRSKKAWQQEGFETRISNSSMNYVGPATQPTFGAIN